MNDSKQFVSDFFNLGAKKWLKKYSGNIPPNMDEKEFINQIQSEGLELQFIDKPTWTGNDSVDLPCYLVPSETQIGYYDVLLIDRGYAIPEGSFKLSDAIKHKTEVLFAKLRIGYIKIEPLKK